MKKSSIILSHIVFWIAVILLLNYTIWIGQFNNEDFFGIGAPENSFFAPLSQMIGWVFNPGNVYHSTWDKLLILLRPLSLCIPLSVFYFYYLKFAPDVFSHHSKKAISLSLAFITIFPLLGGGVFIGAWWFFNTPLSEYFAVSYITSITAAALGTLFYLVINWNNRRKNAAVEKRMRIEGELALLKNQVSPHLLFNTLNNIDSLIMTSPEKASATIVRLGNILRYTIYESGVKYIELDKELSFVKDYIELQNIQYSYPDMIRFNVNDSPKGFSIPPMLLIPFVENTFKHCTAKNHPGAICIEASITNSHLLFIVENSYDKEVKIAKDSSSGIGIANVKRRLNLLYPSDCYELNITQNSTKYKIELKVCLYEENEMHRCG